MLQGNIGSNWLYFLVLFHSHYSEIFKGTAYLRNILYKQVGEWKIVTGVNMKVTELYGWG
jgi:hypothetical protein